MRSALFISVLFFLLTGTVKATALKPDTASINHLLNIAYKELNPDTAIILFDKVLQMSVEANYADGAFAAAITTGIKYAEKEDYSDMRLYSQKAMEWAAKSSKPDATAWAYNNIGLSYFSDGDYTQAVNNYYLALAEIKKRALPPTHTEVNIYNNLGVVFFNLDQRKKALEFYLKAVQVAQKGNFYYQLANSYGNIGLYFLDLKETDSSTKYFLLVNNIGQQINKHDLCAFANESLGKTFVEKKDYVNAIDHLHTAINLALNKYPDIVVESSLAIGDAYYHMGKFKDAENVLESNLTQIRAHNAKDKYIPCYTTLAYVYKATGQYKKAIECLDTLAALKDSFTGIEKTKAISQLELKYKTAEKDKQIAQSQLLIAQQNNKINHKNIWIVAITGSIFLLSLLLIIFYRNARHKERLQAEQIKTLQKENTIGILKGVVHGEDKERGRIARELHDGIGGMLSAAMMRFSAIRHEQEQITSIPAYNEAMGLLHEMGDEIRKTAHNLMPDALLKQTLPEAVSAYCSSMQKDGVLNIDFQSYGDFTSLTNDFKLNTYRIIQELLKNISAHAQASEALVQLMINGHTLTITVEDNGIGFDTAEIRKGMGIQNMQTRVSSMEGQYSIDAEAGKGTTVFIEFDLNNHTI